MQGNRIWLATWRWQCARRLLHLAPRAGRGRFASGVLATRSKSGEGACPQPQTRGYAPSPGFFRCARNPTSPRTRGEVAQVALPRTSRYPGEVESVARSKRKPASCRASIPVMIRLERALGRHADIGRLLLVEARELDADLGQVQTRDLLVEVLWQRVDAALILARVGPQLD